MGLSHYHTELTTLQCQSMQDIDHERVYYAMFYYHLSPTKPRTMQRMMIEKDNRPKILRGLINDSLMHEHDESARRKVRR